MSLTSDNKKLKTENESLTMYSLSWKMMLKLYDSCEKKYNTSLVECILSLTDCSVATSRLQI